MNKTFNNKNYRSLKSLAKDVIKNKSYPNLIKFRGMIFTQDYYDMNGNELTYGNVKSEHTLLFQNGNRYLSIKDTEIFLLDWLCGVIGFKYIE